MSRLFPVLFLVVWRTVSSNYLYWLERLGGLQAFVYSIHTSQPSSFLRKRKQNRHLTTYSNQCSMQRIFQDNILHFVYIHSSRAPSYQTAPQFSSFRPTGCHGNIQIYTRKACEYDKVTNICLRKHRFNLPCLINYDERRFYLSS